MALAYRQIDVTQIRKMLLIHKGQGSAIVPTVLTFECVVGTRDSLVQKA